MTITHLADSDVVADPYPFYESLRAQGDVQWHDDLFGGAWVFVGFDDVERLLKDSARLSNARARAIVDQLPGAAAEQAPSLLDLHSRWMVFFDPPKHTAVRRIVSRGFSKGVLTAIGDVVEETVAGCVTRLRDRATVDVVGEFAQRIPIAVIATLLGVSPDDGADFVRWTRDIALYMGSEGPDLDIIAAAERSLGEFQGYFDARVAERRRAGRAEDDLLSLLVTADPDEELLSDEDLFAQSTLLLFAGFETTKNLLASTVLCLVQHPGQGARVAADPGLTRAAVEEVLRFESPVQFARRIVVGDCAEHGARLAAGDVAALMIGAANRDPSRFARPHEFVIGRDPGEGLSFGAGRHACLGQPLARLEAEIGISRLLYALPELLDATVDHEWQRSPGFRGLARLELTR